MVTELFYAQILCRDSLRIHTRRFKLINLAVSKYRLAKNGFLDPKSFRGFRETGPGTIATFTIHRHKNTPHDKKEDVFFDTFILELRPMVVINPSGAKG